MALGRAPVWEERRARKGGDCAEWWQTTSSLGDCLAYAAVLVLVAQAKSSSAWTLKS